MSAVEGTLELKRPPPDGDPSGSAQALTSVSEVRGPSEPDVPDNSGSPPRSAYDRWVREMRRREQYQGGEPARSQSPSAGPGNDQWWRDFESLEVAGEELREAEIEQIVEDEMADEDIREAILAELEASRSDARRSRESAEAARRPASETLKELQDAALRRSWGPRERRLRRKKAKERRELAKKKTRPRWKTAMLANALDGPVSPLPPRRRGGRPELYEGRDVKLNENVIMAQSAAASHAIADDIIENTQKRYSLMGAYSNALRDNPTEVDDGPASAKPASTESREDGTFLTGVGIEEPEPGPPGPVAADLGRFYTNATEQGDNLPPLLLDSTVMAPASAKMARMMKKAIGNIQYAVPGHRECVERYFFSPEAVAISHDAFWYVVGTYFATNGSKNPAFQKRLSHRRKRKGAKDPPANDDTPVMKATFLRMSENFVNLFDAAIDNDEKNGLGQGTSGSLASDKDRFFHYYPSCLAQTLYYSIFTGFKDSRAVFAAQPKFKEQLMATVLEWTVGCRPYNIGIGSWINMDVRNETDRERCVRLAGELKEKVVRRIENLEEMLHPQPLESEFHRERNAFLSSRRWTGARKSGATTGRTTGRTAGSAMSTNVTFAESGEAGKPRLDKIPVRVERARRELHHSLFVEHYMNTVRSATKRVHRILMPYTRRMEDGTGDYDFMQDYFKVVKRSGAALETAQKAYREAQGRNIAELGERPEMKERRKLIKTERRNALAKSAQYASALLEHYEEKRAAALEAAKLSGGRSASLKSTAQKIVGA